MDLPSIFPIREVRLDGCNFKLYHGSTGVTIIEYRRGMLRGSNVPSFNSEQCFGQPSGPNTVFQSLLYSMKPSELGGKEGEAGQGLASLKL